MAKNQSIQEQKLRLSFDRANRVLADNNAMRMVNSFRPSGQTAGGAL